MANLATKFFGTINRTLLNPIEQSTIISENSTILDLDQGEFDFSFSI